MKYRERNRKLLTLPSGGKILIAKLNSFNEPFLVQTKREGEMEAGIRLAKFALTNPNNGPLILDGEEARIVDKEKPGEGELTISELEQADADLIVSEVIEFSGLGTAGREARKTFPERPETGGASAPAGNLVSLPPDGAAQAAAG